MLILIGMIQNIKNITLWILLGQFLTLVNRTQTLNKDPSLIHNETIGIKVNFSNNEITKNQRNQRQLFPEIYLNEITLTENGAEEFQEEFRIVTDPKNESDLTKFLYYQSKLYFGDKTTHTGLDLQSSTVGDLMQSGRFTTRAYTLFPGTIWCGLGNMALNGNSLGIFQNTDRCCRQHDSCADTIPARSSRHGLTNPGFFTRSHCECDRKFYYCLKRAGTIIADKIGFTYFNLLRPQCFRLEYPILTCIRWRKKRCVVYVIEETVTPDWQWFDNREF